MLSLVNAIVAITNITVRNKFALPDPNYIPTSVCFMFVCAR